jgi:hypothetical protein
MASEARGLAVHQQSASLSPRVYTSAQREGYLVSKEASGTLPRRELAFELMTGFDTNADPFHLHRGTSSQCLCCKAQTT